MEALKPLLGKLLDWYRPASRSVRGKVVLGSNTSIPKLLFARKGNRTGAHLQFFSDVLPSPDPTELYYTPYVEIYCTNDKLDSATGLDSLNFTHRLYHKESFDIGAIDWKGDVYFKFSANTFGGSTLYWTTFETAQGPNDNGFGW